METFNAKAVINDALKSRPAVVKQTEGTIYNNCVKKYKDSQDHLKLLMEKKLKIESEISHLEQKQADRKKFLDEVRSRHQQN